jgi:molybdopterin-containing oxidoreductase family iron-sulfur binding subunit
MSEINRRDFLKVVGVTGAASAVGCDPTVPIENVLPYVVQPAQIVPGVSTWFSTQCNECSSGCGVLARNREGRVVKLEGNPDHPLNKGKLCGVGQAGILSTYSPDRLSGPMKGESAVSWASALDEISAALQPGRVAWVGYPRTGANGEIVRSFMRALGYSGKLYWDPVGDDAVRKATSDVFQVEDIVPSYELTHAHVIVSFGQDFMATQGDVASELGWADSRDPAIGGFVGKTICIEPRIGVSSSITDLHLAARVGSETGLALALAKAVCEAEGELVPQVPEGMESAFAGIDIAAAVEGSGVAQSSFDLVVKDLVNAYAHGRASVVLPGGHATSASGVELAKATLLLNKVLDNIGDDPQRHTVRIGSGKVQQDIGNYEDLKSLLDACREGKTYDVLFIDGIDLAHVLPSGVEALSALNGVGTVVAFANEPNEMVNPAVLGSGFTLPPGSTLETWGDSEAYAGIHTIQQPAMKPLLNTKSVGEILIRLAKRKGLDLAGLASWTQAHSASKTWNGRLDEAMALSSDVDAATPAEGEDVVDAEALDGATQKWEDFKGDSANADLFEEAGSLKAKQETGGDIPAVNAETWVDYLKSYWHGVVAVAAKREGDFGPFWIECLQRGGYFASRAKPQAKADITFDMPSLPDAGEVLTGNTLVLFPHPFLMDGRHANKPWAQETPEPVSSHSWGTWVEVHPSVAEAKGFEKGKTVRVSAGGVNIEVAWFASPGIRPDTMALIMGNGHSHGRYAKVGGPDNPINLIGVSPKDGTLPYVTNAGVDVAHVGNDTTVSAYIGAMDQSGIPGDRSDGPINFTVSVDDLGTGHGPGSIVPMHHFPVDERLKEHFGTNAVGEPQMDMFPEPEHPSHRFAMAIDLNRCNGCNACSIACVAENNIPIVGPEQMKKSRYMGWLRLSRYWEGSGDTPDIRFQPVSCQQCSHAPCEGVCPVLATYHNLDGLNAMVYNRCVGTRYCANNCPYTARRFNFHSYQWPESFNLMLNPDVVTREMGIMEKCTFCVQRIREVKDLYRDEVQARGELNTLKEGRPPTTVPEERLKNLPACGQSCPTDAITFGNLKTQRKGEQYKNDVFRKFQDERAYSMLGELNTKPGVRYLARITHGPSQLHHGGGHGDSKSH